MGSNDMVTLVQDNETLTFGQDSTSITDIYSTMTSQQQEVDHTIITSELNLLNSHMDTTTTLNYYNTTDSVDSSSIISISLNNTGVQLPSAGNRPPLRSFVSPEIQNFYIWCTYIIPFLAIVFNGLSIAVFLQRRLSKAAVSTYLITLAICDTMAVTMIFYTSYIRIGWWPITDLGCQIAVYMTAVGRMCAVWLVVFFTIERFISVRYVFKKAEIITPLRVKASIVLLVCIMLIEQSFVWIWIEKVPPAFCFNSDRKIQKKYFLTLLGLNRVFNFMIPCVLVAVMNSMIVHTIRKSARLTGKTTSKEHNEHRLTVMLVLVSTVNFTLLIPETTAKIMEVIGWFHPPWLTSFGLLTDVISYLSHCCNFFFYVISGKQFRKDFIDMMCCVKCRKQGVTRNNTGSPLAKSKSVTSTTNVSLSNISPSKIENNKNTGDNYQHI